MDAKGRIRDTFMSLGVPESYLIAPDGTLPWRGIGAMPSGAPTLRAAIEQALGA